MDQALLSLRGSYSWDGYGYGCVNICVCLGERGREMLWDVQSI